MNLDYLFEYTTTGKRTKLTHPYNYDPFVIWDNGEKADGTVYSDRLLQWDWDKHNDLCEKHFGNKGQYWNRRDPKKIEAFLCDYFGEPVMLTMIEEHCNQATGYPCWRFDYRRLPNTSSTAEPTADSTEVTATTT
jgi:hypothetical protein